MKQLLIEAIETGNLPPQNISALEWQAHRQLAVSRFVTTCANGHLRVAQWLHATFGLTPADARLNNGAALRRACASGHLAVAARNIQSNVGRRKNR